MVAAPPLEVLLVFDIQVSLNTWLQLAAVLKLQTFPGLSPSSTFAYYMQHLESTLVISKVQLVDNKLKVEHKLRV